MRATAALCLLLSALTQVYSYDFTVYTQGNWSIPNNPNYKEPSTSDGTTTATAFVYTSSAIAFLKAKMGMGNTAQVLFTGSFVYTHQAIYYYSDGFSVSSLNNTVFRSLAQNQTLFSQDSSFYNRNASVPLFTFRNCSNITVMNLICDENYGSGCINVLGGSNFYFYNTTWTYVGLIYRMVNATNVNVYDNIFDQGLVPVMITSSQNINIYNNRFYDCGYRPYALGSQQTGSPFGPPFLVGVYISDSTNVNLTTNYFFNVTMGVYVESGSLGLYGNSFFATGFQSVPVRNYDSMMVPSTLPVSWAVSCPSTSAITWQAFDGNGFCGNVANVTFALNCNIPATQYTSFFDPCNTCAPESVWSCDGSCFNSTQVTCPTPKQLYVTNSSTSLTTPNGTRQNPYPSIRAAMDYAQWRDSIILLPGTYSGDQNQGPLINLINRNNQPFVGSIVADPSNDPFYNNVTIDCTTLPVNNSWPTSYVFINGMVNAPADFLVRGIRFVGCGQVVAFHNQTFAGAHLDNIIYENVGLNVANWQGVLHGVVTEWTQFSITNSLIRHINTTDYRYGTDDNFYFAYPLFNFYPGVIQTSMLYTGSSSGIGTVFVNPPSYSVAKMENVIIHNVSVEAQFFLATGAAVQDFVASNVAVIQGESRIGLVTNLAAINVTYNLTNVVYFPNDKIRCVSNVVCYPYYDAVIYCNNQLSQFVRQTWPWYYNVTLYEQTLPLASNCQGNYSTSHTPAGVNFTTFFNPTYGVMPSIIPAPPGTFTRSICGLPNNFPFIYSNLNAAGQDCSGECYGSRVTDSVNACCFYEQLVDGGKYCFASPANPATTTANPLTGPGTTANPTGPGTTATPAGTITGPGTTTTGGNNNNNNGGGSGERTNLGGVVTPVFYFLTLALALAMF